jgi:hypothetical protein
MRRTLIKTVRDQHDPNYPVGTDNVRRDTFGPPHHELVEDVLGVTAIGKAMALHFPWSSIDCSVVELEAKARKKT